MPLRQKIKKGFIASAPVQSIIRGSKHLMIPGFGDFSLFEIWKPFIQQLKSSSLFERASLPGTISKSNIVLSRPCRI